MSPLEHFLATLGMTFPREQITAMLGESLKANDQLIVHIVGYPARRRCSMPCSRAEEKELGLGGACASNMGMLCSGSNSTSEGNGHHRSSKSNSSCLDPGVFPTAFDWLRRSHSSHSLQRAFPLRLALTTAVTSIHSSTSCWQVPIQTDR